MRRDSTRACRSTARMRTSTANGAGGERRRPVHRPRHACGTRRAQAAGESETASAREPDGRQFDTTTVAGWRAYAIPGGWWRARRLPDRGAHSVGWRHHDMAPWFGDECRRAAFWPHCPVVAIDDARFTAICPAISSSPAGMRLTPRPCSSAAPCSTTPRWPALDQGTRRGDLPGSGG